jgi:hypothetical protein
LDLPVEELTLDADVLTTRLAQLPVTWWNPAISSMNHPITARLYPA